MDASHTNAGGRGSRRWSHGIAALVLACGGDASAQEVVAVPAAHLQHAEGPVAYAPLGDKEWQDVQPRRLLKRGDRLWSIAAPAQKSRPAAMPFASTARRRWCWRTWSRAPPSSA